MTTFSLLSAPHTTTVPCIICLQEMPMARVTAGSLYVDGQQAFACSSHLGERARWIIAWAIFDHEQRQLQDLANLADSQA